MSEDDYVSMKLYDEVNAQLDALKEEHNRLKAELDSLLMQYNKLQQQTNILVSLLETYKQV